MVALLLRAHDLYTKQIVAEALWRLAENNATNKDAIREAGGIPPLVALLSALDYGTRRNAVLALSNLANNNASNKDAIREAGGIRP